MLHRPHHRKVGYERGAFSRRLFNLSSLRAITGESERERVGRAAARYGQAVTTLLVGSCCSCRGARGWQYGDDHSIECRAVLRHYATADDEMALLSAGHAWRRQYQRSRHQQSDVSYRVAMFAATAIPANHFENSCGHQRSHGGDVMRRTSLHESCDAVNLRGLIRSCYWRSRSRREAAQPALSLGRHQRVAFDAKAFSGCEGSSRVDVDSLLRAAEEVAQRLCPRPHRRSRTGSWEPAHRCSRLGRAGRLPRRPARRRSRLPESAPILARRRGPVARAADHLPGRSQARGSSPPEETAAPCVVHRRCWTLPARFRLQIARAAAAR